MTRNNNSKTRHTSSNSTRADTSSNDDTFISLPDLSGLKDDEKQHILNVLLRDENLRNKHLARFMQLKKEVADLEKKSQSTSTSVCARCQTPFGFLFNTGDICPKCSAKVCKQCQLMYNVNDNGWVCQLCCKQMQLLSYSGEWIYSQQNKPHRESTTTSEIVRKSLTPPVSVRNVNGLSSSDSESEDSPNPSNRNLPPSQRTKPNKKTSNNNINPMIVQTTIDEEKLNNIKQNVKKRPYHGPSSQQTRQFPSSSTLQRAGSSDDVDSLYEKSTIHSDRTPSPSIHRDTNEQNQERNFSIPKNSGSLSNVPNPPDYINNYHMNKPDDCASVTSSEWGLESERGEPIISSPPPPTAPIKHNSVQSLSTRMHLTGSIQSLRDATHRLSSKAHLSSSHTSLNSELKSKSEISDKQNKSDSRLKLTTNDSNKSSNTLTPDQPNQRLSEQKKPEIFSSVGNLNAIDDTDDEEDDIDGAIEQAKIDLQKRSSSFVDIRGSRSSLNSITSDTKARYGLDISGTIELKLTYTLKTGALDVSINKCTDLAKAKRHQTSDPFVKVYLLPDRSKNSKRKTAIQKGTTNPVFEERFRYHITKQEFDTRVLWISVWSQSSLGTLGSNDFLGEIHIPLANCILDETQEYQLLARKNKKELRPNIQPTMDPGEIKFQLTFIENQKTKGIGVLQVDNIEGKSIYHGKMLVDCICKGLLMPDNVKRKLPTIRKGPTPRWEIPLRWEGVRLDNLKNTSIEISIWSQERVKKFKLGFVRLNLAHGHFGNRPVPWLDSTSAEKSKWQAFIEHPLEKHNIHLPLRPALVENK